MTDNKYDNVENGQKPEEGGAPRLDPKTEAYLQELLKEKHILSTSAYPHASRLMQEEVQRTQQTGRMTKDTRYADVYRERPIKVTVKVAVPIREYPKFNFVGKLLGPKGNSLKRLQEETMCKMSILGRGSMKDKVKELVINTVGEGRTAGTSAPKDQWQCADQMTCVDRIDLGLATGQLVSFDFEGSSDSCCEEELRKSLDPKFSHLSDDLHIEISALAPPAEAHARIAYALAEIRKFLIPDSNDDISMEQLREMENYLEPGASGPDGEPPQKRPLLRPVRGGFRGRGGCGRGQPPNAFARPNKSDDSYYSNSYARGGADELNCRPKSPVPLLAPALDRTTGSPSKTGPEEEVSESEEKQISDNETTSPT